MTNSSLFESDRLFSVFSYTASHGLLLLRSGMDNVHGSRLDVLFQDVRAVDLPFLLNGLRIEEAAESFLKDSRSNFAAMLEPGLHIYAVSSSNSIGTIVGGIIRYNEDKESFFAQSGLLK